MLDGEDRRAGLESPIAPGLGCNVCQAPKKLPAVIVLHQEHSTPGHIGQWFLRSGHALDIRRPRFGDPLPETLENHCGAVIFGGPMSANDPDDYIKIETEWIGVALDEKKPFFGVCLGAQMLARLLGARVALHPEEKVEVGYFPIHPTQAGRALGEWPEKFYQWHKEGFDAPQCATMLAHNDGPFPNQAFAYGNAMGVQFHPEITRVQVHRWTGNNPQRLTQAGAQPQHAHLEGHLLHAQQVHRWLDRTLSRWVEAKIAA